MPAYRTFAFFMGFTLLLAGLILKPLTWLQWAPQALDMAILSLAALAIAALLSRAIKIRLATALALAAVILPGIVLAGPVAVLATLAVLAAGMAIGTFLGTGTESDPLARWIAGLGIFAALAGWLLPLPLHRAEVYVPAIAILLWCRRTWLRNDLDLLGSQWRSSIAIAPWAASAGVLVLAIGSMPAWLPVLNSDDLAYHLNIGLELLQFHHALFGVGSQTWALAPWLTDLLHAQVMVIAGAETKGPLNAFWMLIAAGLVYRLARRMELKEQHAWLAVMLYSSLPLTAALAGSMQVESATPAMLAALALTIQAMPRLDGRTLCLIAVLAGLMMGSKISNALLLLPFCGWMLIRCKGQLPWRSFVPALALGVFTSGSSYVYAWLLAGNPILPMYNAVFESPWFPAVNFVDPTWQTGLHWDLPWQLTLETSRFFEGYNGCAGLVVLALIGSILSGVTSKSVRAPLLTGLAAALLVFSQVQYLRYFHPALSLLVPALLAGVMTSHSRWHWREMLVGSLVIGQLWLAPSASWIFSLGGQQLLLTEGRQAVIDRFAPDRNMAETFRKHAASTDRLLYTTVTHNRSAELPGKAASVSWHSPRLSAVYLGKHPSEFVRWDSVIEHSGANSIITFDLGQTPALQEYLVAVGARLIDTSGAAALYQLPARNSGAPLELRSEANQVSAALPLDRPHPVVGELEIVLGCDQPGEPVGVTWSMPKPSGDTTARWSWLTCGINQQVIARTRFQNALPTGTLTFSARPAKPDATMTITLIGGDADIRRDFIHETALYYPLKSAACKYLGCTGISARLMP